MAVWGFITSSTMKTNTTTQRPLFVLFLMLAVSTASAQVFVRSNAAGANDGSSWANAYTDLQTALANTSAGEIWVARGTYRPVNCSPCSEAAKETAFRLPPGVQLYGGFNGTESELTQRDWTANATILSGDIGTPGDSTDNVFNVVIAENATEATILDGFIIEEGNADGSFGFSAGGGLYLDANPGGTADLQVRHCTFRNNYAGGGGAVAIDCVLGGSSRALFRDCRFEGNTATLRVVSSGGAVFIQGNSGAQILPRFVGCTFRNNYCGNDGGAFSATPTGVGTLLAFTIDSCDFVDNRADDRGGAVWYRMSSNGESRVRISNSRFHGNRAGGQGGALFARSSFDNIATDTLINCLFADNATDGSSTINDGEGGAVFLRASQGGTRRHLLINCVFDGNRASERGGAIGTTSFFSEAGTLNADLINCTFYGNSTQGDGGALHAEGSQGDHTTTIANSILWQNSAAGDGDELLNNGGTLIVTYSDVAGGLPGGVTDGGNNLEADPAFADPDNGDLHPTGCSPVLNAGNNALVPPAADPDLDGDPRIHQGVVDLGAYETGVIFVDLTATGADNGRSWTDACTDLQDGISKARPGDQIWVARGTYFPTTCAPCTEDDKTAAFRLRSSVEIYGGFNGTESELTQRDWTANPTILSGDIGTPGDSTDNVFNVVIAENAGLKTVLDGFIIEEGNADGSFGFSAGGGLYLDANPGGTADLQVRHCTFRNNYAGGGGAVAIDCVLGGSSRALFRDCRFEGNTASLRVVSSGGAVFIQGNSGAQLLPRFVGCTFRDNYCGNDGGAFSATPTGAGSLLAFVIDSCDFDGNRADDRGGAVWYRMSSDGQSRVRISNSRFHGNRAGGQGGALFARSSFDNITTDTLINCLFADNATDGSSTINDGEGGAVFLRASQGGTRRHLILNCIFDSNRAAQRGGAIGTTSFFSEAGTLNADLINCTFYGNSTQGDGGALHAEGSQGTNNTNIINSIFRQHKAEGDGQELFNNNVSLTLTSSILEGALPATVNDGGNNFSADPQLVSPENGDFRLSSCSPARDTGRTEAIPPDLTDIDYQGDPRIFGDRVDLGALEWNGDPPEMTLAVNSEPITCEGPNDGTAVAVPSGGVPGYSYQWSTGADTPEITGLSPDTFFVTVTDAFNCILTDSVVIREVEALTVSPSNDTAICAGVPVVLSASGAGGSPGYHYSWDNGVGEGDTHEVIPLTTTTYSVTVTDGNNCTSDTSVTITVRPNPEPAIAGQLAFCQGQSTTLDAGSFESYDWSTGATTSTITVDTPGEYSVTVSDATGCSGSVSATITQNPNPEVQITGSATICPSGSTTLQASEGFAGYLWSDNSTANSLPVDSPGDYALTVTDNNGCSATADFTVTESDALQPAVAGQLAFCEGQSTTLDAGSFESYDWSTGATTSTITIEEPGEYSVTVTTGECSGVANAQITVTPNPEPVIQGYDSFCPGTFSLLEVEDRYSTYRWSNGSTTPDIQISEAGPIGVTVTDNNGCSGTATATVTAQERPVAVDDRFSVSSVTGRVFDLSLSVNDILPGSGSWTWHLLSTPDLGIVDRLANGVLSYRLPENGGGETILSYEVCSMACPDLCARANVTITMETVMVETGLIPNTITPNGDGSNDTFVFDIILNSRPEDIPDNRLMIFNRWGDIVYDKRDYNNNWDGVTNDGRRLPDGTYYYVLYLNIPEGLILKGDITILR